MCKNEKLRHLPILLEKDRKVKKKIYCANCHKEIKSGQSYLYYEAVFFSIHYLHMKCENEKDPRVLISFK